jgi:hypothetical protein
MHTERATDRTRIATAIQEFLSGSGGRYDWDDVMGSPFADPELEEIRLACLSLPDRHPPNHAGEYCGAEGESELQALLAQLQGGG